MKAFHLGFDLENLEYDVLLLIGPAMLEDYCPANASLADIWQGVVHRCFLDTLTDPFLLLVALIAGCLIVFGAALWIRINLFSTWILLWVKLSDPHSVRI